MIFDNSLKIAIAVSLICHSCLILFMPGLEVLYPKRMDKHLEITYYQIKKDTGPVPVTAKPQKAVIKKEEVQAQQADMVKPKQQNTAEIKKSEERNKKDIIKVKEGSVRQPQHLIDTVTTKLVTRPAYIDYGHSVREQICVIANKKYGRYRYQGEVFLNFILIKDGTLAQVRIIEEKSTTDQRLKNAALEAVKTAAPFEPFPKDLDFKQLSFNVVISFEP